MDWFLSITTLLVNSGLGWAKGKPWIWFLHAINAAVWIAYSLAIEQYGLILLSVITIVVDLLSAWRGLTKRAADGAMCACVWAIPANEGPKVCLSCGLPRR